MSDLMGTLKAQLDSMNEMYRVGYEAGLAEGKRLANVEFSKDLDKILDPLKKQD